MKITKYEHACLDITEGNNRLVIDPGEFTPSITDFANITAVVITHSHGDHLDHSKIGSIVEQNPDVKIFTTQEVADELKLKQVTVASTTNKVSVGAFTLEFFGKDHAVIDPKTPIVQNVAVLVNNKLYYPGDSLTICPKPFEVLAVPASAPWLKTGETSPLIEQSDCKIVFPTHNALFSEIGHGASNRWQALFAERSGKQFRYLQPGESLEV